MPDIIVRKEEQEDLKKLLASYLPDAVKPFIMSIDLDGAEFSGKVMGVKVTLKLESVNG